MKLLVTVSYQSFLGPFNITKMSTRASAGTSLVKLSASTIIHQDGSFFERCDLNTLPRTVLQEILVASVSFSRILVFKSLIVNWPLEQVVLQKVSGFDEPKAVLLAYCLQRTKNNLKLIDIRGCDIGLQGTTAFCKLAVNLPVSDNDVSGMKILDMRPLTGSFKQNNITKDLFKQRIPPVVVMLDAVVDAKNCTLVIQACTNHSFIELKMSHVTIHEVPGGKDIYSLLTTLEPEFTTALDLSLNGLQQQGILSISPALLPLTNLTELDFSYNMFGHRDKWAIHQIAAICSNLRRLKKLDLSGNYIKAGVGIILQCLQSNLTHLALSGCGVEEGSLHKMCSLETLGHLKSLRLDGNGLANHVDLLGNFIVKSARTLEHLSIEDNMFVSSNVVPLCQMIKQLHSLKMLSLCYNHLLADDIKTFREEFLTLEIINKDWLF